jgi:hypothetical protein
MQYCHRSLDCPSEISKNLDRNLPLNKTNRAPSPMVTLQVEYYNMAQGFFLFVYFKVHSSARRWRIY